MFLFSQIGTDEERNVKNVSENKGGVWIVAIVKYLGLLLLYGGTIRVQCQDLKRNLVGKGREGTGRVRHSTSTCWFPLGDRPGAPLDVDRVSTLMRLGAAMVYAHSERAPE